MSTSIREVQLTAEQKEQLKQTVEQEGFDYAFASYSNFPEIENPAFHEVRKAYLAARNKLRVAIGLSSE